MANDLPLSSLLGNVVALKATQPFSVVPINQELEGPVQEFQQLSGIADVCCAVNTLLHITLVGMPLLSMMHMIRGDDDERDA